jgi:hypothetical protein
LLSGGTTLLLHGVVSAPLLLHRDLLWIWWRVARSVLPELSVEVSQLLVELVPSLGELIEACPTLSVYGMMAWFRLRVGGAA